MSDLIARHLADPAAAWAIGAYGAVAEFRRDALEPAVVGPRQVVTARGAVVITAHSRLRMIEREVRDEHGGRVRSIGFTLPRSHAAMPPHRTLTELGPDLDAVRPQDRAILFDLGLGLEHCSACVRTADPALLEVLRAATSNVLLGNHARSRRRARIACFCLAWDGSRSMDPFPTPPASHRMGRIRMCCPLCWAARRRPIQHFRRAR